MFLGFGFLFRPRQMARLHRAYAARIRRLQGRFVKAHRATGLLFLNASAVILLTWFYPVWIFNCFLIARVVAGAVFPSHFAPLHNVTLPIVPTYWI